MSRNLSFAPTGPAWAEDRVLAAEQLLQDTKLKLKALKRQARIAQSMDEAKRL